MKKSILPIFLLSFISFISNGQELVREVGITFSNFDAFGLDYKTGTSTALWRFRTAGISGTSHKKEVPGNPKTTQKNLDITLSAGREFRRELTDHFQFRYGLDLGLYYTSQENENNGVLYENTSFSPGVNAVIGINYVAKEKLVIGAEILPGISYRTGQQKNTYPNQPETKYDISTFHVGFQSSFATLTLAYRF